ncbi:MAG: NUDIX domain-containing protein [Caldilineaceae bacterium]|nr:NUDIX domain-containing protein [Caldilineaceae bacterium]
MSIDRRHLPKITDEIKRTWQPKRRDFSAGGVAYRRIGERPDAEPTRIEIALIATHHERRWQLPKGTREAGETSVETAIREVEEEAGVCTELKQFLHTVEYWYWDTYQKSEPCLVHKQVDFYLLHITGGQLSDASYEVDAVAWFTLEQGLKQLTFEAERHVLRLAIEQLNGASESSEI